LADATLRHKGYDSFLPLYRRRRRADRRQEISIPVFPGYLFCRFDRDARLPILTTPGVLQIVGVGRRPIPVSEAEIASVSRLIESGLTAEPCPYFEVGQQVRVTDGPLRGITGVLAVVKNERRLVVCVSLLRRAVSVEIPSEWVLPATSPEYSL